MTKKLTITVTDEVYKGLHSRVGRRKISRFINDLARERLADPEYWLSAPQRELADAYAEQAAYEAVHAGEKKEDEAWLNGLVGDVLRTDHSTFRCSIIPPHPPLLPPCNFRRCGKDRS